MLTIFDRVLKIENWNIERKNIYLGQVVDTITRRPCRSILFQKERENQDLLYDTPPYIELGKPFSLEKIISLKEILEYLCYPSTLNYQDIQKIKTTLQKDLYQHCDTFGIKPYEQGYKGKITYLQNPYAQNRMFSSNLFFLLQETLNLPMKPQKIEKINPNYTYHKRFFIKIR